jgi:hypothetical protein
LNILLGSGSASPTPSLRPTSPSRPSRSTHLPGPPAQRPPSLPDDRAPLAFVLLRPSRAPPYLGCAAAAPEPPWPPFLLAPAHPLLLYSLAITPPLSNHALTRRDEPEITRPLNTTSSPAVTRLHRLGVPPPGPYKRPPPPRSDSAPLTASLPSSLTPKHAPVEPHLRRHFTLVAQSLYRSPSSGEPRGDSPCRHFPSRPPPASTGKLEHNPSRSPVASRPCLRADPPWTSPRPWSTKRGPSPRIFHCKINQKS